jgi:hypothetical protein
VLVLQANYINRPLTVQQQGQDRVVLVVKQAVPTVAVEPLAVQVSLCSLIIL